MTPSVSVPFTVTPPSRGSTGNHRRSGGEPEPFRSGTNSDLTPLGKRQRRTRGGFGGGEKHKLEIEEVEGGRNTVEEEETSTRRRTLMIPAPPSRRAGSEGAETELKEARRQGDIRRVEQRTERRGDAVET